MTTEKTERHVSITVIGNPGTGKTTLAKWLSRHLPAEFIAADELYLTNPYFQLAVDDRKTWSLKSDTWFLEERVKLYAEQIELLEKGHIVIDSGLPMSYVYAHSRLESGYFTQDEWEKYQALYLALTADIRRPDIIINLCLPIEDQRRSIVERGRDFEVLHHTEEYLKALQNSIDAVCDIYRAQGTVVIDLIARGQFMQRDLLEMVRMTIKNLPERTS